MNQAKRAVAPESSLSAVSVTWVYGIALVKSWKIVDLLFAHATDIKVHSVHKVK